MARLAPLPPTDFSSRAPLWWQGWRVESQAHCQACQGSDSALLECYEQSLLHGEHIDFFRNTFEKSCGIATQHATRYEVVVLCPAQGSFELTPSSGKEAPSDVVVHNVKEEDKGSKNRCKQRPQGTMTTTNHDDGNDKEAESSSVRRISTTADSDKRQTRPPIYHFKRLLKEACPNHAYLVRHKLKDRSMMRSFMTLGSLTWVAELDEDPGRSDTTPFLRENAVMTVHGGRQPPGKRRMSDLSPKAPTHCGWGHGGSGV
jgi:hypothetical protein